MAHAHTHIHHRTFNTGKFIRCLHNNNVELTSTLQQQLLSQCSVYNVGWFYLGANEKKQFPSYCYRVPVLFYCMQLIEKWPIIIEPSASNCLPIHYSLVYLELSLESHYSRNEMEWVEHDIIWILVSFFPNLNFILEIRYYDIKLFCDTGLINAI